MKYDDKVNEAVLIVGSGEDLPEKSIIKSFSCIVCADGGYDRVKGIVKPIAVIGDMDSIASKIEKGVEVVVSNRQKDETDTELALKWCIDRGYEDIYITGTHGTRPDHFYASIVLLMKYKEHSLHILTDSYDIFIMEEGREYDFSGMKGTEVSLFSVSTKTSGIVSDGFRYEYRNISLSPDNPLGVSNEIIKKNASISFKKGNLLCFVNI